MTDIEKNNEITRIISNLRKKYSLEDIKCILKDARIKVITLINYGDYLPEETDDPPIDESDLPF